jgi:glycerol-3-phosphate dehydrogenase
MRDVAAVSQDVLRRLALTYGTRYDVLLQLIRDEPGLADPLGRHCLVTGAEIVHAVRAESAVRLLDALVRRTEAGSAGHPGSDAIERAAALMALESGWGEARRRDEVAAAEAFYRLPA